MIFNGAGADAKMTPGLLVGRAGRELLQYFTLPTGQWFAPGKLQRFVFGSGIVGVAARIIPDCLIEPAHDLAASRRFFDEVQRAVLDGADRLGDIALPRDHEDRRGVLLALMLFPEIETGSAGDMHVEQSAGRRAVARESRQRGAVREAKHPVGPCRLRDAKAITRRGLSGGNEHVSARG